MVAGFKHPDHAKRALSYRQFLEWMAYLSVEPQGEIRADLRMGILASVMAQAHAGKNQRFKPVDFMPKFEHSDPEPMSVSDMQAAMQLAVAAHNNSRRQ